MGLRACKTMIWKVLVANPKYLPQNISCSNHVAFSSPPYASRVLPQFRPATKIKRNWYIPKWLWLAVGEPWCHIGNSFNKAMLCCCSEGSCKPYMLGVRAIGRSTFTSFCTYKSKMLMVGYFIPIYFFKQANMFNLSN